MPARILALALLLLLCATTIGWATEPAGATVVLQLPASMSPDQVKGLIADLAAKGAEPTATPVDRPSADPPPLMTGMKLTVRIWEETKQAMRAVPGLRQVPQVWVRNVEAEGGTRASGPFRRSPSPLLRRTCGARYLIDRCALGST